MSNPTVKPDDIRNVLIDRFAKDNFLLDNVEFDDGLLASAMTMMVSAYNETPPMLSSMYTIETFPFKYYGAIGAAGHLLRSMSINMARNQLNFTTTSGMSVQDKDKATIYRTIGNEMWNEYMGWMKSQKVSRNMEEAYGGDSGIYQGGKW